MRISDWSSDVCSSDLIESESPFDTTIEGRVEGRFALDVIFVVEILRPRRVDQETDLAVARAHPVGDEQAAIGARLLRNVIIDAARAAGDRPAAIRSEEHTSELQSLMRISYAVFCLKKKKKKQPDYRTT